MGIKKHEAYITIYLLRNIKHVQMSQRKQHDGYGSSHIEK